MKKLPVLVIAMFALILLMGVCSVVNGVGFTTGFTFTLDEPYPLEHVYVVCGDSGTYEDILLPGGVMTAGFTVPIGTSDFALEQVLETTGMNVYAVMGTYVDGFGTTHLVLGTGEDLTGVYWGDVVSSPFGLTYSVLLNILENGIMPDLIYIIENLHTDGHMAPFGTTIQLYFFSDGQPLEASVLSNDFGNPEPPTPLNNPPVADPDGPYAGTVGVPVTFDGTGSHDPDGDPLTYDWDFGDGSLPALDAGPTPTHTYAGAGVHVVVLTVTDDGGMTDSASATATIAPQQVIPEVPLGTIVASAMMIFALVGYFAIPKFRKTQ